MGPPSYMRSVVDRNVVMRSMTIFSSFPIQVRVISRVTYFLTLKTEEMRMVPWPN